MADELYAREDRAATRPIAPARRFLSLRLRLFRSGRRRFGGLRFRGLGRRSSRSGLLFFDLLVVALAEAVDTACRVDELLSARVERVAGRADVDRDVAARGARDELIPARA